MVASDVKRDEFKGSTWLGPGINLKGSHNMSGHRSEGCRFKSPPLLYRPKQRLTSEWYILQSVTMPLDEIMRYIEDRSIYKSNQPISA